MYQGKVNKSVAIVFATLFVLFVLWLFAVRTEEYCEKEINKNKWQCVRESDLRGIR